MLSDSINDDTELQDTLSRLMTESGAVAWGIATGYTVNESDQQLYDAWLKRGDHARMDYMCRNREVRFNPVRLLDNIPEDNKLPEDNENLPESEDSKVSVIVAAFTYHPGGNLSTGRTPIALYGRGRDYHDEIGERLGRVAEIMRLRYGGEWRVAVDTLPLRERYWGVKAGIGYCGLNGALIVPGYGSMVVLGEIITDAPLESFTTVKEKVPQDCGKCGACMKRCPGGAINPDGTIDCRKCLSYLTIEHRGEFDRDMFVLNTDEGRDTLFGCDICLRVCPHNLNCLPTKIEAFLPQEKIITLTPERIITMQPEKLGALLRGSALRRARVGGLKRNARNMLNSVTKELTK